MITFPAPPTVRMMGRLALPLGSTLVAGAPGLDRAVRWARASGVLSPLFPRLGAEEVALLDLPLVREGHPSLALNRVVRELSRLRIAAIVVRGNVDQAARREADRCSLPLFQLPTDAEVARTTRAIIRLVSDPEAQVESQAAVLYRYLSELVAAGKNLADLAEALYRLSTHSVQVRDQEGRILARAGWARSGNIELARTLSVGNTPVAVLSLHDSAAAFDDFSRIALEQGGTAMALELAKMEAVEAARAGVYGDFIASLLLEEEDTVVLARARAADYPVDVAQWAVILVVEIAQMEEEPLRVWTQRLAAHAERMGWKMRVRMDQTTLAPLERLWQVVLLVAGGALSWGSERAEFLEFLRTSWQGTSSPSLGVGEPASGLVGLRRTLAQASDALSLGLRLFGPGRSYLHRELGLYRLLRHLRDTEELEQFLARSLVSLQNYDCTHGTELVETLRHFLDHGGNISATARAMHLHRNSLAYRLERIRAISGLDPTSPEDAFTLRLALLLAPLR